MSTVLIRAIAYCVPVTIWIVWRRKTSASVFPLLLGMAAYIIISLLRGVARGVVFSDSLKSVPLLFYFVSALLSGVFEEVGRFVVFRHTIVDSWVDCVSYGIGHVSIELILTHDASQDDIYDSLIGNYYFATGIAFSVAMSALVYIAANYADSKKFLAAAIGIHTFLDFIAAGYFLGAFSAGELDFIDLLFTIGVCYFSYRMYKHFSEY